jgi:hypothetical protein
MDDTAKMPTGAGEYIWLRYATQFTTGGRTHTIEIGIPMPVGASAETREQLLQEADAGMNQLAKHVEKRIAQMHRHTQPAQEAPAAPVAASSHPSQLANKPAPAPQSAVHQPQAAPAQVRESPPEPKVAQSEEVAVPPTRPKVGASMPSSPGASGDGSGNMLLPQFIQYIKENLGLNPKQAMDMLRVKTLSGINLREALEQLQAMMGQEHADQTESTVKTHSIAPAPASRPALDTAPVTSSIPPARPVQPGAAAPDRAQANGAPGQETANALRDERPIYIFEEEVDPEADGEPEDELDDLDLSHELTQQERVKARTLLNKLREARGATAASSSRLQALHNVVSSQITAAQLHDLVEGVWMVSTLKKLKVDQVEMLISWAKEDDFVSEVEMLLALLEEDNYARGNR